MGAGLAGAIAKGALLLADRLYGRAVAFDQVQARCTAVGSHYLIRVRKNLKARVITRLLGVAVHDPKKQRRPLRWLQVSEVQVQVRRAGRGTEELRLWTGLLNPKVAPALALVTMYGQRWQHELYYRQMKI